MDFGLVLGIFGIVVTVAVAVVSNFYQWQVVRGLKKIFTHLTTPSDYIGATAAIHKGHYDVRVLAHTPGLLLPSERDAWPIRERNDYFDVIHHRLRETEAYHLEYLFDLSEYKSVLASYLASPDVEMREKKISDAKGMFLSVIAHTKTGGALRLKYTVLAAGTPSMVIGEESVAGVGYRPLPSPRNTEWVIIHEPALVKIVKYQFQSLFDQATDVGPGFFDNVLQSLEASADSKSSAG